MIPLSQLFQELPVSAASHSAGEGNFEMLGPTLSQVIKLDAGNHTPMTAGALGVPSFEIAVSGVTCFKPKIEEQGIHICKLTQGDSVNGHSK